MWKVRLEDDGYFVSKDNENSPSSSYVIPWTNPVFRPSSNSVYNLPDETVISEELNDVKDDVSDAYSWIKVDDTPQLPSVKSVPVSNVYPDIYSTYPMKQNVSFHNGREKTASSDICNMDTDKKIRDFNTSLIYGNQGSIFLAGIVRLMLIGHNVLTVWRVTNEYKDNMYWIFVATDFFLLFECIIVIIRNAGKEYSWWSPCILIYLVSTIPPIWLLQYKQLSPAQPDYSKPDIDVWVIVLAATLVILLLFCRWLLPRGKVSRDHLADLLLEFLAISSDIMELLAVFDAYQVRGDLKLFFTIMAVWSASLIQFIFVFMRRNRYRKFHNVEFLTRYCGGNVVEIVAVCTSMFLQDLPFLVVRLYIIIEVKLITYSLIFFLLKNIVTLMFLFYRLTILCYRHSCNDQHTKK